MSEKGHIVHKMNSKTVQQKNRSEKNVKNVNRAKRSLNQIDERLTGPHNTTIPKH
jgi:hypothetical protein